LGDIEQYQPLTKKDKISVVLYRLGIGLSSVFIGTLALISTLGPGEDIQNIIVSGKVTYPGLLLSGLFLSVGLSVFFIHLYVSSFHRVLKRLYFLAFAGFLYLLLLGDGNPAVAVLSNWFGPLLLLPLAGCLGFITAKEAFCFKLLEGYLLALAMPVYLVLAGAGMLSSVPAIACIDVIAVTLFFFTLRKVFMPLHYDIGDKSAYQ